MAARFDIIFDGELIGDSQVDEVRARVKEYFKLSDEAVDRLFGGKSVTLKRKVDMDTASKYRERFRQAGALIRVVPVASDEAPSPFGLPDDAVAPAARAPAPVQNPTETEPSGMQLSEQGSGGPLEPPPPEAPPAIDTSYLSLVEQAGWTLEDCDQPPEAPPPPDISHLELVVPRTPAGEDGD